MKIFIILTLLNLSIACGSSVSENKHSGNSVEVSKSQNNSIYNKTVEKVEKQEIQKTEQTEDLPKFQKDEDYKKSVREKLLKSGWTPARSAEGDENCKGQKSLCDELPELEAGPSSPLGQAVSRWKKNDKVLLINTIENFLYDSYEYEKSKKTQTTQDIQGKYIYSSKHEYGEDQCIFELQPNNVASYIIEAEGRDGVDLKGKWEWNEATKSVVVYFSDSKKGVNETYVFNLQGKDLKMIKEPKMPEGVRGFTGKVYKKQ